MPIENRLLDILKEFAEKFELPFKPDPSQPWADIGFSDDSDLNFVGFAFDPDENYYEFVSAIGTAPSESILEFSNAILTSEPIRGITERIDETGKIIVVGGRDGLKSLSNVEIMNGIMDDLARVAESKDQTVRLINFFAHQSS